MLNSKRDTRSGKRSTALLVELVKLEEMKLC